MVKVNAKVEPITRDIELMLRQDLSADMQAAIFADFAKEQIKEAEDIDKQVLGHVPRSTVTVDGREDASLKSIKPNSTVVAEFDVFMDVLLWIAEQLEKNSPVGTPPRDPHPGLYRSSHTLFADGMEIKPGEAVPEAEEYVFTTTLPYARKIEHGQSSQAPDGVYQVLATLASRRFGNVAKISFTYRTVIGGEIVGGLKGNKSEQRNPAILVRVPR
jgi:hypothetical protein